MRKHITVLSIIFVLISGAAATTLSVSDIEYESNSEFFNGELIAIELVADDSTETLQTTIPASQISESVEGETSQDVEIEITENRRSVEYGLEPATNKIDVREGTTVHAPDFNSEEEIQDWAADYCVGGTYAYKQTRYWNTKYDAWCVADTGKVGTVGEFREDSTSPRSQFEVTYQLNVEGQPSESVTLSNSDVGQGVSADLGSNAKIQYLGNYELSTSPEGTSSGALALHSNSFPGNWRVISEDRYTQYRNYINYNLEDDLVDWANGDKTESDIQDTYSSYVSSASSPHTSHELSDARTVDGSLNSGVLEYTPASHLFHPSFMVYINAGENGYLTINRPTGVPEIVSTEGGEAGEFDSGEITLTARNQGDYEGQFSARISSCSDNFDFDSDPRSANLGSGETTDFSFTVGFDSGSYEQQEIDGSCTVELSEVSTGETVSTSVDMVGVQETECTEGKKTPGVYEGEEAILECTDGFNQEVAEICDTNSEGESLTTGMENGEWTCVVEDDGDVVNPGNCQKSIVGEATASQLSNWDGTVPDPVCMLKNWFGSFTSGLSTVSTAFDVLVSSVAALIGWAVGRNYFSKVTDKVQATDNDRFRTVLGLVTAILFAVMAYGLISQWWVKLLLLVALAVAAYFLLPLIQSLGFLKIGGE
jgi:hypothetical protein